MARPEEQESQIVNPGYDMSSSPPPNLHDAGHAVQDGEGSGGHQNSDDTLSDPNPQEAEAQQESFGSHIEETQFSGLYPETQQFDETEPSLQTPTKLSQPIIADSNLSAARPASPPFVSFLRPTISDSADDSGFKFGKARKATFAFGRHGKSTDVNTNAPDPTTSAATSNQVPVPQTQLSGMLQYL